MKVTGSTIQQLDKSKPRSKCRKWRLWAATDHGRKSKRFEGTYSQAQEALRAFVEELEGFVPNSETFGAYAESWRLWRAESGGFSPNTVSEDRRKVAALRRTALDGMRMDEITSEDCRDALLWLKHNPKLVESYSNTSMVKFHQTLSDVFSQAVADGKLARNPMDSVAQPKPDTMQRDALSPGELMLLLNRIDEMPLDGRTMALYLMACLGLRRGEACSLLDSDVRDGICVVRSTVRAADGSTGRPKTNAGNRTLPVPQRLEDKIAEWREVRTAYGVGDAPTLCCTFDGGTMSPDNLGRWWSGANGGKGARSRLGCDGMVLHQLRHSNLSMVARHMNVFDLQRYAGWSSIAPARIYVHDDFDSISKSVGIAWESNAPNMHHV